MIRSLTGIVTERGEHFAVIDAGGVGFKVFASRRTLMGLPDVGQRAKIFCFLVVREGALDLYGFQSTHELSFFELLLSVSGVGPRSALSILEVGDFAELAAAIQEGKPDVLARASGVGRKTAERIIVELKTKVAAPKSAETVKKMEANTDILSFLESLGYAQGESRDALARIDPSLTGVEDRLRAALKELSGR